MSDSATISAGLSARYIQTEQKLSITVTMHSFQSTVILFALYMHVSIVVESQHEIAFVTDFVSVI